MATQQTDLCTFLNTTKFPLIIFFRADTSIWYAMFVPNLYVASCMQDLIRHTESSFDELYLSMTKSYGYPVGSGTSSDEAITALESAMKLVPVMLSELAEWLSSTFEAASETYF